MEKVRNKLGKLKDNEGWVVIHGLPGFGKSTLAAESLRCASLLQDVFPGGVFWLTMHKMSHMGVVNEADLLNTLQSFFLRVDKNKGKPQSIQEATKLLETVMRRQHPRSLLILDNIREEEVAKVFSGCPRVLATTRNAEVAIAVNTPFLFNVPVNEGFTDEEAAELLSQVTEIPPDSLPKQAKDIIQCCMGSPLALGIIAAKFNKHNTSKPMWERIVKQLKSRSQSYNLLARMDASIGSSMEELSKRSKEKFHSLVVFANSAVISIRGLGTFWSMSASAVAEIMEG